MPRRLAVLLLIAACQKPTPKPADAAPATPPPPPAADAAPKASRDELVKAALARVPAIREKVSKLRGLDSKDVPAEYQSAEDFAKFLQRELDTELPPEKSAAVSRAM